MRYLGTRVLSRMLRIRRIGRRTNAGTRNFQLFLVIRLIRQQHTNFTPTIEEESYSTGPDYQHQYNNANFDASYLKKWERLFTRVTSDNERGLPSKDRSFSFSLYYPPS